MSDFLTQDNCDRCGLPLTSGRIMSMFNTDCICMECKDKERSHPLYEKAQGKEMEEVKRGNYNYKGIGYPEEE